MILRPPIRVGKSSEVVRIKGKLYKGFFIIFGVARKFDSKVGCAL